MITIDCRYVRHILKWKYMNIESKRSEAKSSKKKKKQMLIKTKLLFHFIRFVWDKKTNTACCFYKKKLFADAFFMTIQLLFWLKVSNVCEFNDSTYEICAIAVTCSCVLVQLFISDICSVVDIYLFFCQLKWSNMKL